MLPNSNTNLRILLKLINIKYMYNIIYTYVYNIILCVMCKRN